LKQSISGAIVFACLESISTTFYEQIFADYLLPTKLQTQTVSADKFRKTLLYKNDARKMLVKLTPGVNFINILLKAFKHVDPKSAANTVKPSVFFALSGSERIKALGKMLV